MSSAPSGWQAKTLDELCEIARGGSPRPIKSYLTDAPDGVNWIKIADATASSKYIYETKEKIKPEGIQRSRMVEEGDFILSNSMSFGRPYIMRTRGCIHDGWLVLRDKSGLFDQDYLYYFLGSPAAYSQFDKRAAGSTVRNLNIGLVKSVEVLLPPLSEQQRIVAILDDAFERIDAAIANTEKNLANARELFESYLNEVFESKGEGWVESDLADILEIQPRNGWSPPAKHHSDVGVPVLTLSAVTGFQFRGDKIKHTSAPVNESAHYWVHDGDLLITRSNTTQLVGHVAICEGLSEPTIYPDLIMRMKVAPRKALTKFVYYQLRAEKIREIIRTSATGANPTMKKIKKSIVQGLPVVYPSIEEQSNIVDTLEELTDKTQALESLYSGKLAALTELKQSILQKAFAGELTADMNQEALVN